ncbi:hypothetical protein ACJIZ3_006011 [Penstemon smallii]|uniref:Uncharacterized protein n=1 Tax=Penstemon smallii TaxID=265156 RepID=A0ABD3S6M6_9LAMI
MVLEDWAVDVEEAVNNMEDMSKESELKKKRCIYRVPDRIRELDNNAFKPQVVSFGPYYYNERDSWPLEEHKNRALLQFLKRSQKHLPPYLDALAREVEDLKYAYDQDVRSAWLMNDDERFLKMMILDGCFILEILGTSRVFAASSPDPIYLNEMPLISRDMLLLENQVPLRVLEILQEVIYSIRRFFGLARRSQSMYKGCLHILDVYRRGLLVEPLKDIRQIRKLNDFYDNMQTREFCTDIPSATELHEAGIRFKISKTAKLNDITFKGSTLRLPPIMVTDDTKSFFLNLMAFERVHVGAGNEVTSYVFFMGCLIKSDRDASLLRSFGFVPGALGSDEDVAQLYRLISKKAMLHPDQWELVKVLERMNSKLRNRVMMRLSAWRLDLLQNYLKSPWGVVSVIGAIIIFTLTAIQTVYTVLSYIHRKDK